MRFASTLVSCLLLMCSVGVAHADKRVALVIGNSAYRNAPALMNPRNDAQEIDKSLRDLGFSTIVATDLDRAGMNDALDRFSRMVGGAEIALVYYSGHGMQFAGKNFLLPVEARLESADDVNRFRLMPVEDVFDVLQGAPGARIVILDACRNNPVEDDLKRRLASTLGANRDAYLTRGFSRVAANGLIVAYATQANDVAADGVGRNSPFATALLHNMGTPDLDLRQMLFNVQDEVDRLTGGKQRPELSISLVGQYKLNPATGTAASKEVVAAPQVAALPPSPPQVPVSAAAPVVATLDVRRFDGLWVVDQACDGTADRSQYGQRLLLSIRSGILRGEHGLQGRPGGEIWDGTIEPDGSLGIFVKGITALTMKHPNVEFVYQLSGQLEGSQGSAIRLDRNDCRVKIAKQSTGAGAAVAAFSTQPSVPPSLIISVPAAAAGPEQQRLYQFDGVWTGKLVCRATPELPGWSNEFVATVKNSVFHGERGSPGTPNSESFDGTINQDGSAELTQMGLSGATEKDPFHRPVSTSFRNTYLGSFELSRGAFIRSNRPSCTVEFTRQIRAGSLAPPSRAPDPTRFDGMWIGKADCEAQGVAQAYSYSFVGRVKDGVFHGEKGVEGQPDWVSFDGTFGPDGGIELNWKGITGRNPALTLNNDPPGRPFAIRAYGALEGSHGTAIRVEGRTCRLEFTKEEPRTVEGSRGANQAAAQATSAAANPSPQPSGVSRALSTSPPSAGERRTRRSPGRP